MDSRILLLINNNKIITKIDIIKINFLNWFPSVLLLNMNRQTRIFRQLMDCSNVKHRNLNKNCEETEMMELKKT